MSALTAVQPAMRPTAIRPEATPVPDESVFRLTVEEYLDIAEKGALNEDHDIELLEGLLVEKIAKNQGHIHAKRLFRRALERLFGDTRYVDEQEPVATTDSVPEPDILVLRGRLEDYATRRVVPDDVAIVIEVSDSTLRRDRGRKKRIYARAAVPVYWIVNLIDRQVEVYTAPSGPDAAEPDYAQMQTYGPNDALPVVLDGTEVGRLTVHDLLP